MADKVCFFLSDLYFFQDFFLYSFPYFLYSSRTPSCTYICSYFSCNTYWTEWYQLQAPTYYAEFPIPYFIMCVEWNGIPI